MTQDMCPFILKEVKAKSCPGCKIEGHEAKKKGLDGLMEDCLDEMKKALQKSKHKREFNKVLSLELYKLKRITTREEEEHFDVIIKKNALEILDFIKRHKPDMNQAEEVEYTLNYGDVLFNLGELDSALKRFIQASQRDPQDKRSWNNIGVTMVRQGKLKEALPYYDKALERDPTYGSAWFNKGKALFKLGMKKKALVCFRKATKYSPENKSAWNNLGVTLRQLKEFKESIKCYNKALKIHSDYPWAWHNKGVALMELKRYKDAMMCFDKALHIDPDYEPAKESKREVMRKVM
jgi:tetratricopeptide (TPR) repeat protein